MSSRGPISVLGLLCSGPARLGLIDQPFRGAEAASPFLLVCPLVGRYAWVLGGSEKLGFGSITGRECQKLGPGQRLLWGLETAWACRILAPEAPAAPWAGLLGRTSWEVGEPGGVLSASGLVLGA